MPVENPHDDPAAAAFRAAQADPLVMYLIVRREADASFAELVASSARAVVRCARLYASHPVHGPAFAAWYGASYRKVTLRANERDWAKLLAGYDIALGGPDAGSLVGALPPLSRSTRDKFLAGLQAYTTDIAAMPVRPVADIALPALGVLINPDITMSAGKALAQVGHGALMAADRWRERDPEGEYRWLTGGANVRLLPSTETAWASTRAHPEASLVTDSGLTEIASGSETVLALPLR